jgi:Mg-chelatase subunit ChlD
VFSGSELYLTGRADAVKAVTTSGWIMNISNRNPNFPVIAMPNLDAAILKKAAGYKTYSGSAAFSQSNIFLNQSIKVENAVSFNSSSFTGSCYVIAGGNISYNIDTLNYQSTNKLVLYSQNGDITISGNNVTINGIIYAPHGKVTFNVNTLTLNGRVIADKVLFSGSQFNVKGSADDLSFISDTGVQKTYTTTADFAAGALNGLSTNKADELTLADKTTSVPVKTEATFGDTTTAQGIKIVRSTDKDILTPKTDSLALQYDLSGFGDATTGNGVDLVIAMDVSTSMDWNGRFEPAKAAAREVISQMKANDRCAVVRFTSSASTCLNFSSDKALLTATIDALQPDYNTEIGSGIDESLRILAEQSTSNRQKYIILLSDGESNDGPSGSSQSAAVAGSRGVRIFALIIGTGTFEMQKIAINSNGIYRNSPTPDQISAIMSTFADEVFNTAGRNAAFTTTIKDAATVDLTAVSPAPTTVVSNSDGSVTLTWSYDKITVSEAKTISIPLTLKGLSDAGIVDISKNTSCVYYNRDGLPTIIYLDDFSMPVSRYVSQGTWSAV